MRAPLRKTERELAAEFKHLTETATKVACQECGAPIGEVCIVQDVAQLTPHMSRFMSAQRRERWSA